MASCPQRGVTAVAAYDTPPYQETWKSLSQALTQSHIPVSLVPLSRMPAPQPCRRIWVAIGSKAIKAIRQQDSQTPLVAVLILNERSIAAASPATGITLLHPLQIQWRWFRYLLPHVRHLGVLYDPRFAAQLHQLSELARRHGVTIIPLPVATPRSLPQVLERLPAKIEALWLLGDGRLFSATTAPSILLTAYRDRIVPIGLSRQWVEAGAAYALDWDYTDLGRQTAELVLQIWQSQGIKIPPPAPPRRARLAINQLIFQRFGLSLPDPLPEDTIMLP